MWYEINVTLNGRHFFATHQRSITDDRTLRDVYSVIAAKFPASEGFDVQVTRWEERGTVLDTAALA